MRDLEGQVAIVTGGSGALGRACALALADEGAAIIVADIGKTRLVVTEIHDRGEQASGVHCDVANTESARAMVSAALDTFGRIDVLVNNAAILGEPAMVPYEDITDEDWDRAMAVNLKGMWQAARMVAPTMRRTGRGKIINMGGDATWRDAPGMLHIATSKAAVPGFTRSLASEEAGSGIDVNMIEPGVRGTWGGDLARALVFLAGSTSDGISGQIIDASNEWQAPPPGP